MQDLPDKGTILLGIAQFLDQELRPQVQDKATAFRVRIAAHLLMTVVRELGAEAAHDQAELAVLRQLLGDSDPVPSDPGDRGVAIHAAHKALAEAIRAGEGDLDAAHDALTAALADRLSVSNPRFDLDLDLP